jgi:hypothetical protein
LIEDDTEEKGWEYRASKMGGGESLMWVYDCNLTYISSEWTRNRTPRREGRLRSGGTSLSRKQSGGEAI